MSFLFHMSIPGEASFLEPLLELAVKVAEYAGYRATDAQEIGASIRNGAAEAIRLAARSPMPLEIVFRTRDAQFEVTLSYDHGSSGRPAPQHLAESFRCGREGHLDICRMSRSLPEIETGS